MARLSILSTACLVVLLVCLSFFVASAYGHVWFPGAASFLMAVPAAVVFTLGFFRLRAALGLKQGEELHMVSLSKLVVVAGVLALFVTLPALVPKFLSEQQPGSAERVADQSWFERGGHYFTRINSGPEREISRAEFESQTAWVFQMMVLGCVVFSLVALHISENLHEVQAQGENVA